MNFTRSIPAIYPGQLLALRPRRGRLGWLVVDGLLVALAYYLAFWFRFADGVPDGSIGTYFADLNALMAPLVGIYLASNYLWRLDRREWRYASAQELIAVFMSAGTGTAIAFGADLALGVAGARALPLSIILLGGFFAFSGFVGVRYRSRLISGLAWRWQAARRNAPDGRARALLYGAGESGQLLAWRLQNQKERERYQIVGFIDDDPAKRGLRIHGIEILGDRYALAGLVERLNIDLIILAMTNVEGERLRAIVTRCQETSAEIRILRNSVDRNGPGRAAPLIREVTVEDLLGRSPVSVDHAACAQVLAGKAVLVTGGCGSIGSELCRQIASFGPERLILLDNNESGLFDLALEMENKFPELNLTPVTGDITDEAKLTRVFRETRPQVVFHVAAYKHVPLMEEYPEEAVRVNVGGTRAVVDAAVAHGVERFVLVSSDKAVNPSSVMGATKRVAELLVMGAAGASSCRMTAVRFGNVLGSRGSVIPTFARQIELGGPVTVTDAEATRFFMEISEAASLILQAATLTDGRDIFMLEMGERIRVDELARRMIRMRGLRPGVDIPIVYTGLRPGEKLHEELYAQDEARLPTAHPQICRLCTSTPLGDDELRSAVARLLADAQTGARAQLVADLMQLSRSGGRRHEPQPATAA